MHWEHLHQTCVFVSSVPSRHDSSREVDLPTDRYRIVQTSIVPPRKYRFVCHWGHTSFAPPYLRRSTTGMCPPCNFFIESVKMILENRCAVSTSGSSATAHSCREKRGSTVQFPARPLPARSALC